MSTYVISSIYFLSTVNLFLFLRWSGLLLLFNINLLLIQINNREINEMIRVGVIKIAIVINCNLIQFLKYLHAHVFQSIL